MYHIPTNEMNVIKGEDSDGYPRFRPLAAHDLKALIDPEIADERLSSYFPGRGFYGPLVGGAELDDMRRALSTLRMTLELHAMLEGCDSLIDLDPDNWFLPTLCRAKDAEHIATDHLRRIDEVADGYTHFSIRPGKGCSKDLNGDDWTPQCHILTASISLTEAYAKWMEQRVAAYNAVIKSMPSSQTYYLHTHNQTALSTTDGVRELRIDVFGTLTLDEGWDEWLDSYEQTVPEGTTVSALERVAGLRHLADTLATIHLTTAIPIVDRGEFIRAGAEDSLTDLWRRFYDPTSHSDLTVSSCEVCGKLYIGTHKGKRGHEACMNRQRVARSRARKFMELVGSGLEEKEASRLAGISAKKAKRTLSGEAHQ